VIHRDLVAVSTDAGPAACRRMRENGHFGRLMPAG
jgi:hypothetical protein